MLQMNFGPQGPRQTGKFARDCSSVHLPLCSQAMINAAQIGDLNGLKILLAKEKDPVKLANISSALLARASIDGHFEVTKFLLSKGADFYYQDEGGYSCLYKFASRGNADHVQWLLNYVTIETDIGLNVNIVDWKGGSVLYAAIANANSFDVAKLLVNRGFDVNQILTAKPEHTCLIVAAGRNNEKIVKLLLENGARMDLDSQTQSTPLYMAVQGGFEDIVRLLLLKGANPNSLVDGVTALHCASANGFDNLVKILLRNRADVNLHGSRCVPPLHVAMNSQKYSTCKLLLAVPGVDVNVKDHDTGTSTLVYAVLYGNREMVDALLDKGADINSQNIRGHSLIFYAFAKAGKAMCEYLISRGARLDTLDHDGNSLLMLMISACNSEKDHLKDVQLIIEKGVDLNVQNKVGDTALMQAIQKDFYKMATLVLEKGANVHIKNKANKTALQLATARNANQAFISALTNRESVAPLETVFNNNVTVPSSSSRVVTEK